VIIRERQGPNRLGGRDSCRDGFSCGASSREGGAEYWRAVARAGSSAAVRLWEMCAATWLSRVLRPRSSAYEVVAARSGWPALLSRSTPG